MIDLGPWTCTCCGDRHMDVDDEPLSPTFGLCMLCQPCPICGQAGNCDPYGTTTGMSPICHNRDAWLALIGWWTRTWTGTAL